MRYNVEEDHSMNTPIPMPPKPKPPPCRLISYGVFTNGICELCGSSTKGIFKKVCIQPECINYWKQK